MQRTALLVGACVAAMACGDDGPVGDGGGGAAATAGTTTGAATTTGQVATSGSTGGGDGGSGGAGGHGGPGDGGSGGAGGRSLASGGGPPLAWSCQGGWYDDGVDCDCGCGAPDLDCEDGDAWVYGCGPPHRPDEGTACTAEGRCAPPAGWACEAERFADGEVCDCECGDVDVDCVPGGLPVEGCRDRDDTCSDGRCVAPPPSEACQASHYGVGDGCDCGCPAYDVDCDDPDSVVYGCGPAHAVEDGILCRPDGGCPVPAAWSCEDEAFHDFARCDCSCGADDPDCDIDLRLPVPGCDTDQLCLADECRDVQPGDVCSTALVLEEKIIVGEWTVARNDYEMGDGIEPNCFLYQTPGRDIAYRVDLLAGQTLTVDAASESPVDLAIYVLTSCDDLPASCVAAADDGFTGMPEHLEHTAEQDGTVYFVVDQYREPTPGTFTLDVDIAP